MTQDIFNGVRSTSTLRGHAQRMKLIRSAGSKSTNTT